MVGPPQRRQSGFWALVAALLLSPPALASNLEDLSQRALGPTPSQLVARQELGKALKTKLHVRWDTATGCPASITFDPPVWFSGRRITRRLLEQLEPLFGSLPLEHQQGRRGPHLTEVRRDAGHDWATVDFEQRLGEVVVHESRLRVFYQRGPAGYRVRTIRARVFADVPHTVARSGASLPKDWERVVTPRPDGVWKEARAGVEFWRGSVPHRVLRSADGQHVLSSHPLELGGRALAAVYPRRGGDAVRQVGLPDLEVVAGGRVLTTGEDGSFPGSQATLPAGLTGAYERLVVRRGSYPSADASGRLLISAARGDAVLPEANVFYHLAQVRRFLGEIPGLRASEVQRPTLALVLDAADHEQVFNASASSLGTTYEGRRYGSLLRFGPRMARNASVIAHERAHALLFEIGLQSGSKNERILHEGYADYLAATYTGDPWIGSGTLGTSRRNIDDDRSYPRDFDVEDAYASSLIISGALWDARQAAGGSRLVDAAALQGLRSGITDLLRLSDQIVKVAHPSVRQALQDSFARHGLVEAKGALNVIVSAGGGPLHPRVELRVGERRSVFVDARDEAELTEGLKASRIKIGASGPAFMTQFPLAEQTPPEAALQLDLAPIVSDEGLHEVSITVQSALTGRVVVRTFAISVLPASQSTPQPGQQKLPGGLQNPLEAVRQAPVGETTVIALSELFRGIGGEQRFSVGGDLSAGVAQVGDKLIVRPEPGEEGLHMVHVFAEPAGVARDSRRVKQCNLLLVVTSEAPRPPGSIQVFQQIEQWLLPSSRNPTHTENQELPPGRAVTVFVGRPQTLTVMVEGPFDRETSKPSPTAKLASGAPAWISLSPDPATFPQRNSAQFELLINPPASARATRVTITIESRERDGTLMAQRQLELVVVPEATVEEAPEERPGKKPAESDETPRSKPGHDPVVGSPPPRTPLPPPTTPLPPPTGRGFTSVLDGISDSMRDAESKR